MILKDWEIYYNLTGKSFDVLNFGMIPYSACRQLLLLLYERSNYLNASEDKSNLQ